jgi:hypothetical protein
MSRRRRPGAQEIHHRAGRERREIPVPGNDLAAGARRRTRRADVAERDRQQHHPAVRRGHDSTVSLISHCVLTVLRSPWSIALLRNRPELIPGAIEEVLRLQSSVQFFPSRSALAGIEIAGTTIPKGAPIFLM